MVSRGHLHRLLQNVYYTGRVPFEGQIYQGKFKAIVSVEVFDKVQVLLKREKEYQHDYLFPNLIRCARCGHIITAELRKEKYIYYHCTGGARRCRQKKIHISEQYLFNQFQKAINKIKISPEKRRWIEKELRAEMKTVKILDRHGKSELDEQLNELNNYASNLYNDKMRGAINQEFWEFKNKEIMEQINSVQAKIEKMSMTTFGTVDEAIMKLNMIDKIPEMFANGGYTIQKELAKIIFQRVTLKGRLLEFTYAQPFRYFVEDNSYGVDKEIEIQ